jgi:hypothetical protein
VNPAETATLELACDRCGHWWMRWTVDVAVPFDEQRLAMWVPAPGVVKSDSPGSWLPASNGRWYRWMPRNAAGLPPGTRYVFACPNGCPSGVQAYENDLLTAVTGALRHLHEARTPLLRTTVDRLLIPAP